jgi:hypothetical protein
MLGRGREATEQSGAVGSRSTSQSYIATPPFERTTRGFD